LYLYCAFSGDYWNRTLLRVVCIDLKNLQGGFAGRHASHHDTEYCAGSVHAGRTRLACRGDDYLAALRINPLHDCDFLRTAGKKATVPDFLNLNDRWIVVNQKWD
jgi:hypothetical protein